MENLDVTLQEILEVDSISDEDVLVEFEMWDSLSALSIISVIGDEYKVYLSVNDLMEAGTIGKLKQLLMDRA